MKKGMLAMACAVALLVMAAMGDAAPRDWRGGIRARINEARGRIERGIQQGSLTRQEARRLQGELDGILNKIDRMREDGDLSPREREIINRDLDRLDRDITREKRDGNFRRR